MKKTERNPENIPGTEGRTQGARKMSEKERKMDVIRRREHAREVDRVNRVKLKYGML